MHGLTTRRREPSSFPSDKACKVRASSGPSEEMNKYHFYSIYSIDTHVSLLVLCGQGFVPWSRFPCRKFEVRLKWNCINTYLPGIMLLVNWIQYFHGNFFFLVTLVKIKTFLHKHSIWNISGPHNLNTKKLSKNIRFSKKEVKGNCLIQFGK